MLISLSNLKMISFKGPKDRIRFDVTLHDENERAALTLKGWMYDAEERVWLPGRVGRGGRNVPVGDAAEWLLAAVREALKRDAKGMIQKLPQPAVTPAAEPPEIAEIKTRT